MAPSILLSGFADEAANSKTLDQQFSAFAALGMRYFSIRFVDAGGNRQTEDGRVWFKCVLIRFAAG